MRSPITRKPSIFYALTLLLISNFCFADAAKIDLVILDQKPHFEESFTQGLIVDGDHITESSGLYGKSYLVRYNALDNHIVKKINLPQTVFAEGITQVGDTLYLLTWKEHTVYIINANTFNIESSLTYQGEGWGITHDGTHLITSDGSDQLSFRDIKTFRTIKTIRVHEGDQRWSQINELEFAQGLIWANVWQGSMILAIDPTSGEVVGKADLSKWVAINDHSPNTSVLNGIAYDKKTNSFWITGKLWPNRYQVNFIWPKSSPHSNQPHSNQPHSNQSH